VELHVQEKESIQNTVITPEKESPKDLPDAIILEKEDHDDMEKIVTLFKVICPMNSLFY